MVRAVILATVAIAGALLFPQAVCAETPSTRTLALTAVLPPAVAPKADPRALLEIAELLKVLGDKERAAKFANTAQARGLAQGVVDASFYMRPFRVAEYMERPNAVDPDDLIRPGSKAFVPPERWVIVIMRKMTRLSLKEEALAFGQEYRWIDPKGVDEMMAQIRKEVSGEPAKPETGNESSATVR